MKKLFIHHPLFRLLSPFFSGIIVYLLILLLNNNVMQLQEQFFGEELYLCIGLSYLIQEFSRALLLVMALLKKPLFSSGIFSLIFKTFISLVLSVVVVTISIIIYYKYILGFEPNKEELWLFNVIFSGITLIYILLFLSHQYLYKINSQKLKNELLIKQQIKDDFIKFERGINPKLLFESFESLIVLLHQDQEKAEIFIDELVTVYRYILSNKDRQLVSVTKELAILKELVKLFNNLPYRNITIVLKDISEFLIVPGSLLFIIEQIVRKSIVSSSQKLSISITESDNELQIAYQFKDKISKTFSLDAITEIERIYKTYSTDAIKVTEKNGERLVQIPKLKINHSL